MSWKVLRMQHKTNDGFVVQVVSSYESVDGAGYARQVYMTEFTESTPDFIPYEDLTEEIVLEWVKESLGADVVAQTEAVVNAQCQEMKQRIEQPITEDGLPWLSEEEPEAEKE